MGFLFADSTQVDENVKIRSQYSLKSMHIPIFNTISDSHPTFNSLAIESFQYELHSNTRGKCLFGLTAQPMSNCQYMYGVELKFHVKLDRNLRCFDVNILVSVASNLTILYLLISSLKALNFNCF